jgi:hypothetical protein
MAPVNLNALSSKDSASIFQELDQSFRLKPDTLVELSKAFLNEISQGLSQYNFPMAMMYEYKPAYKKTLTN